MQALNDVHDLRYGYNLADMERLARAAVARAHSRFMDYTDRYDAAWHAIAEALYTAEQRPASQALLIAGMAAVNRVGREHERAHGYDGRNPEAGLEAAVGWLRYWELARRPDASAEERIVDRLALWQIWQTLSPSHREVLHALAVHGDAETAAMAIGKKRGTFDPLLARARREFFTFWHEGETPSRLWGRSDHRCTRTTAQVMAARRRKQRWLDGKAAKERAA